MFKLFRRNNKDLGDRGEKLAVKFLRRQGYKILERNFRIRQGEIDIVARDGEQLVFVEVKTRGSNNQEFLRTSVNRGKGKRLFKTASYYLGKQKYRGLTSRFDVVFVVADNGNTRIEHIKDAF
jgi:putative endonuclease